MFANGLYQGYYLDPATEFTASRAPELHWQLSITHRGSPPKVIFQNSLSLAAVVSRKICVIVG